MVNVDASDGILLHRFSADAVVLLCLELLSPAVELEVEKQRALRTDKGDEAVVACPGIVRGHLEYTYPAQRLCGEFFLQYAVRFVRILCHNDEGFSKGNFHRHFYVAFRYLGQYGRPVCSGMGPGQLYAALGSPFGGQKGVSDAAVLRIQRLFRFHFQRKSVVQHGGYGVM